MPTSKFLGAKYCKNCITIVGQYLTCRSGIALQSIACLQFYFNTMYFVQLSSKSKRKGHLCEIQAGNSGNTDIDLNSGHAE